MALLAADNTSRQCAENRTSIDNKMNAKPITYKLLIQCARPEIGVMAEYSASSPFPTFRNGDHLELLDCEPRTWDVGDSIYRIASSEDGGVVCLTVILVDSSVVENTGYVVRKQSGEEVGPSKTRFGRIRDWDTAD